MNSLSLDENTLRKLYEVERLPLEAVADAMNTNRRSIARYCVRYGIKIRHQGSGGHPLRKGGQYRHNGYVYVLRHGHPRANAIGYVMRAIINWEDAHGIPFPEGKFPHHDNETRDDDRPENIMPKTRPEHTRLHNLRRQT